MTVHPQKKRSGDDLASPKKKMQRPSKDDCRGTIFSKTCEGRRTSPDTYWCATCDKTKDENRFLGVERIVRAESEAFKNKNKQFLHDHRCKRLLINSVVHYVLESAEVADFVIKSGGVAPYQPKHGAVRDAVTYHWSGKQKKYIHGPKPNSRNPCITCAKENCSSSGNRSCDKKYCSKHCRERGNIKCGVHPRAKPSQSSKVSPRGSIDSGVQDVRWDAATKLEGDQPGINVVNEVNGGRNFDEFFRGLGSPYSTKTRGAEMDALAQEVVRTSHLAPKKRKKLHNSSLFSDARQASMRYGRANIKKEFSRNSLTSSLPLGTQNNMFRLPYQVYPPMSNMFQFDMFPILPPQNGRMPISRPSFPIITGTMEELLQQASGAPSAAPSLPRSMPHTDPLSLLSHDTEEEAKLIQKTHSQRKKKRPVAFPMIFQGDFVNDSWVSSGTMDFKTEETLEESFLSTH